MELRPYQQEAYEVTLKKFEETDTALCVMATGLGKTIYFSHIADHFRKTGRIMIIAHREELIFQAQDKIQRITDQEADIEMGADWATGGWLKSDIVISTVQTQVSGRLGGRMTRFKPDEFSLLVIDECFPAGTLIDGVPIEKRKVGDRIRTFHHYQKSLCVNTITHVFKRKTDIIVEVKLMNGKKFVCTPNHPIFTLCGYKPAGKLLFCDMVLTIIPTEKEDYETQFDVPCMQETVPLRGQTPQNLLLAVSKKNKLSDGGKDEPEVRIGEDEEKQSDAQCGNQSEGFNHFKSKRMEASCSWWKWARIHISSIYIGLLFGLADGSCDTDKEGKTFWLSKLLQSGYRKLRLKSGCRGGRQQPQSACSEKARCKKSGLFEYVRVDSVTVFKRGSSERFEQLCPKGVVYNLEVENDNNYFVENTLVHNCHHAPAATYRRVIDHYKQNKNLKVLGVTATPDRKDGRAMGQIFNEVAYSYDIRDAIDDGWLVPIEQQSVFVKSLDYSEIKTTAGDLNGKELAGVLEFEENLHAIASPTIELTGSKKTLIFAASVAQAERLTEIINRHKPDQARFVYGKTPKETRREMFKAYADHRFQYLVNVGVATEGFDDPDIECVVLARPTKSRAFYTQMCLDDQTQILTENGWKAIYDPEIKARKIASFDTATGEITWERPYNVIKRKIQSNESYYGINSPSLDIVVTNQHDMIIKKRKSRKHLWSEWQKLTAQKVSQIKDLYKIPVAGKILADGVNLTDDELRFIGWVMTDGTINKTNGQIVITQGEHQPWLKQIEDCLIGCGFKYNKMIKDRQSQFKSSSKVVIFTVSFGKPRGRDAHLRGWGVLRQYLSKDFAHDLLQVSIRQFGVLLEAIHLGDGKKCANAKYIRRSYHISTGNETFADRLQMLCVTRGYRCNKSTHHNNQNPLWTLHIKKRTTRTIGGESATDRSVFKKIGNADNRKVWCVSVRTGAIVTRRNGKVAIVGNCGRGTRPLEGLVDQFDDAVERREAIAGSRKSSLEVIDFVGNAGRHKLMTAADILGGKYDDDVVALAAENAAKESAATGKPVDVATELQAAEREIAKRQAAREDAAWRDKVKLRAFYSTATVNPFNVLDVNPVREAPWHKGKQPTRKQLAYLHDKGVNTDGMSFTHASQVIDTLFKRQQTGKPTYKQTRQLYKRGIDTTKITFEQASKMMGELANNRWQTPVRWYKLDCYSRRKGA